MPGLLAAVDWRSDRVEATLELAARGQSLAVSQLPPIAEIDGLADVARAQGIARANQLTLQIVQGRE